MMSATGEKELLEIAPRNRWTISYVAVIVTIMLILVIIDHVKG